MNANDKAMFERIFTRVKVVFLALIALFSFACLMAIWSSTSRAAELADKPWSIADMNKTIDQTNFIVNGGCSGTLISVEEKLVLTNYHCIDNLVSSVEREITNAEGWVRKVRVRIYADVPVLQNRYDGFIRTGSSAYVGEIVFESKTRDLALLKLKGSIPHTYASPLLPWDGVVARGDRIYSVGNPAGEDATLGEGIVSNVNRTFDFSWTDGAKLAMIQFSGGLFGGNSGGALYNDKGQLIGVPAAGYRAATFIGFAVPVTVVKGFLKDSCYTPDGGEMADGRVNATGRIIADEKCRADKKKKADKDKKDTGDTGDAK
jgi:S1-C subfamily serine protease